MVDPRISYGLGIGTQGVSCCRLILCVEYRVLVPQASDVVCDVGGSRRPEYLTTVPEKFLVDFTTESPLGVFLLHGRKSHVSEHIQSHRGFPFWVLRPLVPHLRLH